MSTAADNEALLDVVHSAQRALGVLAARSRGDARDAADLFGTFGSDTELAGGSLMLAQLTLGLYADSAGLSFEQAAQELSVQLEASLA